MLLRFRIAVLLSHSEIDNVDHIGGFRSRPADEEIIRFDVSINQILLVNGLDSG